MDKVEHKGRICENICNSENNSNHIITRINKNISVQGKEIYIGGAKDGAVGRGKEKAINGKYWAAITGTADIKGNINTYHFIRSYENNVQIIDYDKVDELVEKLLKIISEEEIMDKTYSNYKEEIKKLICEEGCKQIILTGAPGTGKTKMAKEIAKEIGGKIDWKNDKEKFDFEFVQFHPSYDYTNFVEGLQPVEFEGKIVFKKIDGIFKKFCRNVAEKGNEKSKYFFIIDEINRADLSKVFGELMYCLESDKRGDTNRIQTQYQMLPTFLVEDEKKSSGEKKDSKEKNSEENDCFKDGFYIPENVIIIGTMNDIDRSVESMDFALRRRFLWKEIKVTKKFCADALKNLISQSINKESINKDKIDKLADGIANQIEELNKIIKASSEYGLNEQYFISQGQFAGFQYETLLKDDSNGNSDKTDSLKKVLDKSWDLRIEPLLREYVRGEANADTFISNCQKAFIPEIEKDTVGVGDNIGAENNNE